MDDFEVDDLIAKRKARKQKVNSGDKGDRGEYEVIDILNARFKHILDAHQDWGEFSRSTGSGNRWAQVKGLSKAAKDTYAGDITIPTNFLWVIESKNGYNDVDIFRCFKGKCTELDEFLEQVDRDATFTGRKPVLVWKKTRQTRVAFVKQEDLPERVGGYSVQLWYKGWIGIPLPEFVEAPDLVFFSQT